MGGTQSSGGHRGWVMKGRVGYFGELGWTFSSRQWMVIESV